MLTAVYVSRDPRAYTARPDKISSTLFLASYVDFIVLTPTHRPSDSRLQWCGERNAALTAHTPHTRAAGRARPAPAGGGAQEEIRENQNARARARAENPATATRDGGVRFALLRYTYTARRLATGMHGAKKDAAA